MVFAGGGTTVNFTIPAGGTAIQFDSPLALQTGTVAGTISVTLRLQAGGIDITPSPAPALNSQVNRAAPVLRDVQFTRSAARLLLQSRAIPRRARSPRRRSRFRRHPARHQASASRSRPTWARYSILGSKARITASTEASSFLRCRSQLLETSTR